MNKSLGWGKYVLIYLAGFLTSFSGILEDLVKIPVLYSELKKTYIYDSAFLTGHWSTNDEYFIGGADRGLDFEQPKIILNLQVSDDGSASGEILSEKICDALPLTWIISLEAEAPGLREFFFDRKFYLKQLREGKMQTVGVLKLVNEDRKNASIAFSLVGGGMGALPEKIVLAKDLPQYEEDFKELSNYCAESPTKFWKEYYREQGKTFP